MKRKAVHVHGKVAGIDGGFNLRLNEDDLRLCGFICDGSRMIESTARLAQIGAQLIELVNFVINEEEYKRWCESAPRAEEVQGAPT